MLVYSESVVSILVIMDSAQKEIHIALPRKLFPVSILVIMDSAQKEKPVGVTWGRP